MLVWALIFFAVPAAVGACKDKPAEEAGDGDDCNFPPAGSWSVGMGSAATFDLFYLSDWVFDKDRANALWAGLEAEVCDWDEGWGFPYVHALSLPLSRLMNAAHLVTVVHDHSSRPGWGLWRPVAGLSFQYEIGNWWTFVDAHGDDEWEPSCQEVDDDGKEQNASHISPPPDEFNTMHNPGSYRSAVLNRAATIVHEVTHQDVSHLDDVQCPAGASCDDSYGKYNATTMAINFLHDAYLTYVTEEVEGSLRHKVAYDGESGLCHLLPRFSEAERTMALTSARIMLDTRFRYDPQQGLTEDDVHNEVLLKDLERYWSCDLCEVGQYVFDADSCQQSSKACNEILAPGNEEVNETNRDKCLAYNAAVVQGVTPEEKAAAWSSVQPFASCLLPTAAELEGYCGSKKATADHVDDLDPCGWISGTAAELGCMVEFCMEEFQDGRPWPPGSDPHGCLDALCGDGQSCGTALDQQKCKHQFLVAQGDPEYYTLPCYSQNCHASFVECVMAAHDQGSWSYGDPPPAGCLAVEEICEAASRLANIVLIEQQQSPFEDPGPLQERPSGSQRSLAVRDVYGLVEEIRAAAAQQDQAALDGLLLELTETPERIASLFQAAPQQFVWLFGSSGFDEILGPGLDRIAPDPIEPADLSPFGQRALAELQAILRDLPEGSIRGAIGTIAIPSMPPAQGASAAQALSASGVAVEVRTTPRRPGAGGAPGAGSR